MLVAVLSNYMVDIDWLIPGKFVNYTYHTV